MTPEIILGQLEIHQNTVIAVFIAMHVLAALLRVAVHLGIRAHTITLNFSKPLKSLNDINRVNSHLLRRIAADYISAAKKNPGGVRLDILVEKHVLALNFFGWRYAGIKLWVEKTENTLVLLGLVLALMFQQYAFEYAGIAAVGFIILKAVAAFFEFTSAETILKNGLNAYLEREIGAFFAGHTSAAIVKFKEEMSASLREFHKEMSAPLEELRTGLAAALQELRGELAAPLHALSHLHRLDAISRAAEDFALASEAFSAENFNEQSELIRQNQRALEKALESYEIAMQGMVQTMGDGLGTFIQLYSKTAAEQLVEVLESKLST